MRRRRRTICLLRSTSMILCYVCLSAFLTETTSHEGSVENRIQGTIEQTSADQAELMSAATEWYYLFYGLNENPRMVWTGTIKDNTPAEKYMYEETRYSGKRDFSIEPFERITSQRKNIPKRPVYPRRLKNIPRRHVYPRRLMTRNPNETVFSRLAHRGAVDARRHRTRRSDTSIEDGTLEDLFSDVLVFSERALHSNLRKSMASVRADEDDEQLNFDADQEAIEAVEEENLEKRDANDVVISKKVIKDMEDMIFSRAMDYVNNSQQNKQVQEISVSSTNTTNVSEVSGNSTLNASITATNDVGIKVNKTEEQKKSEKIGGKINVTASPLPQKKEAEKLKGKDSLSAITKKSDEKLKTFEKPDKIRNEALKKLKNKKENERKEKDKKEKEEKEKKEKEKKEKEKKEKEKKEKEKKEKEKKEKEKKEKEKKEKEKKEKEKKKPFKEKKMKVTSDDMREMKRIYAEQRASKRERTKASSRMKGVQKKAATTRDKKAQKTSKKLKKRQMKTRKNFRKELAKSRKKKSIFI